MTRPRSDRIVPTPIGPKLRQGPSSAVWNRTLVATFAAAGLLIGAGRASADIDPSSGIDFVTIGAVGNAPYAGFDPNNRVTGRGGVAYEYRIGRLEVTSAQWAEFFSAAYDRPASDRLPFLIPPTFWGGVPTTPTVPGGRRWTTTPQSAMLPTGDISWRMAAMYCNWLHNDKRPDREAFLNGAYDVSTFGQTPIGRFTDQLTHHPDARYWIPTLDEWIKAAHYDPAKPNSDGTVGGWWDYSNSSDTPYVYGPPGVRIGTDAVGRPIPDPAGPLATANAVWRTTRFPGLSPFSVPLGAYPGVTTPWGLLDAAGGTSEWIEEAFFVSGEPNDRYLEGSAWNDAALNSDRIWSHGGGQLPMYDLYDSGFRIASIPSPGVCSLVAGCVLLSTIRRRRDHERERVRRGGLMLTAALAAAWTTAPARADIDPLSGIDFVTIGAAGNAPYQTGDPNDLVNGRGSVGYEYKIGRMEVTSAQWAEFFSAAFDRAPGDAIPHVFAPGFWGGISTTPVHAENPNARRWTTTVESGMRFSGDITWRTAAIYCNWLHNDKRTDRAAFLSGAYDVSTFGYFGNIFTDQLAHSPGARYYIPTLDEWMKAAHYDPQKPNGDGSRGGWWTYSNGSDTPYVYGPPGVGQANATLFDSSIPLGAYPNVTSPWGLLDVAGGTTEWTETTLFFGTGEKFRVFDGSSWIQGPVSARREDSITQAAGAELPEIPSLDFGFRIASTVPAPGPCSLVVGALLLADARRRGRRVPLSDQKSRARHGT
jgi:formylglycine-generating enzyme required for sulfatase activity